MNALLLASNKLLFLDHTTVFGIQVKYLNIFVFSGVGAVRDFRISQVAGFMGFELSWLQIDQLNGETLRQYDLSYRPDGTTSVMRRTVSIPGAGTERVVERVDGLSPTVTYEFRVAGLSEFGPGVPVSQSATVSGKMLGL